MRTNLVDLFYDIKLGTPRTWTRTKKHPGEISIAPAMVDQRRRAMFAAPRNMQVTAGLVTGRALLTWLYARLAARILSRAVTAAGLGTPGRNAL
jgi:hypothetical protein